MSLPASKPAWLLNLGGDCYGAVGHLHLVHLVVAPACSDVPHSPFYCQKVYVWQGNILPVMDLASRLAGHPALLEEDGESLLGIVAFQETADEPPRYGGVLLSAPPQRIDVTDEQAAELPEHPSGWQILGSACFEHPEHGPVPILNLPAVFSLPHPGEKWQC
ncbi:chemotaxis protein CheW [Pseudomonadota bacterium]